MQCGTLQGPVKKQSLSCTKFELQPERCSHGSSEAKTLSRDGLDVTSEDVKYGLNMLKEALPKTSVRRVVKLLYNGLMKRHSSAEPAELRAEDKSAAKDPASKRALFLNFQKCYAKNERCEFKCPKPVSKLRRLKTRFVAQVIHNRDYGAAALDEQMRSYRGTELSISRKQYKIMAESIAAETFRAIQRFLSKDCRQAVISIDRSELRTIFRVILNFRAYFGREDVATMLKFISSTYGLSDVTISGHEAMRLYRALKEKLKSRRLEQHVEPTMPRSDARQPYRFKGKENSSFYKIDQVWSLEIERELLELYRVDQSMSSLKAQLVYIHPELRDFVDTAALRSKFETCVRKTLIKMKADIEKTYSALPQLLRVSDEKTKLIQRAQEALELRLQLIDFYLKEYVELEMKHELRDLILNINSFIKAMDGPREVRRKPKCIKIYNVPQAKRSIWVVNEPEEHGSMGFEEQTEKNLSLEEDDILL